MTVPFVILIVSGIAMLATAIFAFFDLILTVLDLLFLRAALILAGYLGLLYVLEEVVEPDADWLAPGDGGALATSGLLLTMLALTWRYKLEDDAETLERAKDIEARATARRLRGVNTAATITKIERTGLTINTNPQVELTLGVPLHDGREAEVKIRRLVDIVDIPRFQPGKTVCVRYDREDPANFEVLWDETPPDHPMTAAGDLQGTAGTFGWPLWLFGMEDAETWLLPPRPSADANVVIFDITDPYDASADDDREVIVDLAAFLLSEHLWLHTDLNAAGAAMIDVEGRTLIQPVGTISSYEDLRPAIDSLNGEPIVVWGAALEKLDREGIQLVVRRPADDVERTLSGPVLELGDMLIDWLERDVGCERTTPPTWYRRPGQEWLADYCRLLHNLQLQILAAPRNEALAPLAAEMHEDFVRRALDAAQRHAATHPQLEIVAAVTAVHAHQASACPSELRASATERVLANRDPKSALHRLSPHLLRQLGEPLAAHTRAAALRADAEPHYRAWLDRVEAVAVP